MSESNYESKKKLFHILEELTDQDILILIKIVKENDTAASQIFMQRHISNSEFLRMSENEKFEYILEISQYQAHLDTLIRYNLIVPERLSLNIQYGIEDINEHIDKTTGLPKIKGYSYSILGKCLVDSIRE